MAEYDTIGRDASYITKDGEALIAKLMAAKTSLLLEGVQVGTGDMPEDLSPHDMTGASGYEADAMIEGVTNPCDGQAMIGVQLTSIGLPEGLNVTNLAVMARDPDRGVICYAYISLHEHPQWVRPDRESVNTLARFLLYILASGVQIVEAVINPDVLITFDQMEAYFIKIVRPACLEDAQFYVDQIHNLDPVAHPWLRKYLKSLEDQIIEILKMFGGQGSSNFFYDFVPAPWVSAPPPWEYPAWKLTKGVWNTAENRVEY